MDYDHNSPTLEHYKETHEPFFKIIREKNPDLPIIILTRPRRRLFDEEYQRIEVAKATYNHAIEAGDKKVSFIVGGDLLGEAGDDGLVDMSHPTDLGFYFMAKRLTEELSKYL
jgi:hypothetical protein